MAPSAMKEDDFDPGFSFDAVDDAPQLAWEFGGARATPARREQGPAAPPRQRTTSADLSAALTGRLLAAQVPLAPPAAAESQRAGGRRRCPAAALRCRRPDAAPPSPPPRRHQAGAAPGRHRYQRGFKDPAAAKGAGRQGERAARSRLAPRCLLCACQAASNRHRWGLALCISRCLAPLI